MPSFIWMTIALEYFTVALGVSWGWLARNYYWNTLWLFPGAFSVILLAIEACLRQGRVPARGSYPVVASCAGQAVYAVLVMFSDPFVWPAEGLTLLYRVMICLVPLISVRGFVESNAWFAVVGSLLFMATCIACLFYNALGYHSGTGFFMGWVD